ncbi:MAG: diacylglycerol kinase family lipid kinase [Salibacteraceae bacterium]
MKALFIVNGISKQYAQVIADIEAARSSFPNIDVSVESTKAAGDGFRIAHKHAKESYDAIIACGGDGTMNEVLNGVSLGGTKATTKLGLIACGSANEFARTTGKKTAKQLLTSLRDHKDNRIDNGIIFQGGLKRRFLNVSTAGIGGLVHRQIESNKRSIHPWVTYMRAMLWSVLVFQRPTVRVTMNGEVRETQVTMIAVGKGNFAAYGLSFTPQSSLSDGQFGITILYHSNFYQFLTKYFRLRKQAQIDHPWIEYLKADSIKIEVLEGRLPVESDGEYVNMIDKGETIEFKIEPASVAWL